jgi:hypothetical protein
MALAEFLPLDAENWITCGNALRLDWLSICPPTGTGVKFHADDLFAQPLEQAQIDFDNQGGETYICGNPPYAGANVKPPKNANRELKERLKKESEKRKDDLKTVFEHRTKTWKSLDYVAGWFIKAADYGKHTTVKTAFVSTNSICQGQQVPNLWPLIYQTGHRIIFAYTSFKWANLATNNAGVTVVIVGISMHIQKTRKLYSINASGQTIEKNSENINTYLVAFSDVNIKAETRSIFGLGKMQFGNHPYYGTSLIFSNEEARKIVDVYPESEKFIRPLYGSSEFISGIPRSCLWIEENNLEEALSIDPIKQKIDEVYVSRINAKEDESAQKLAKTPYRFRDQFTAKSHAFVIPRVSSENREFFPIGMLDNRCILQDAAIAMYDAPLWNFAIIASSLHLIWIKTVCGQLETRIRYSNTLGWNTFPVPAFTEKNKIDLTQCAEDILLARDRHFPETIASLYEIKDGVSRMPDGLRHAHERNDEVLERIYIGRRFKNDTERLEKLFDLYTQMTAAQGAKTKPKKARASA